MTNLVVDGAVSLALWAFGTHFLRKRRLSRTIQIVYTVLMFSPVLVSSLERRQLAPSGRAALAGSVALWLTALILGAFMFLRRLIVPFVMFVVGIATVSCSFFAGSYSYLGILGFYALFFVGLAIVIGSVILGIYTLRKQNCPPNQRGAAAR